MIKLIYVYLEKIKTAGYGLSIKNEAKIKYSTETSW